MLVMLLKEVPEAIRIRRVVTKKQSVEVRLMSKSSIDFGKRSASYIDFDYEGQKYSVRVSRSFLDRIKASQVTRLLHLPEYPALFLPPDYDGNSQSTSFLMLILLFTVTSGYSVFMLLKEN